MTPENQPGRVFSRVVVIPVVTCLLAGTTAITVTLQGNTWVGLMFAFSTGIFAMIAATNFDRIRTQKKQAVD